MNSNETAFNKNRAFRIFFFMVLTVVLLFALLLTTKGLRNAIDAATHSVRKELLGSLTESSAELVKDNIEYGLSINNIFTQSAKKDLAHYSDIDAYFADIGQRSCYDGMIMFFVDSRGKYYASDGVYGKITDLTYYTENTDDALSYISTLPHLPVEKTYLIFRNRLAQPIRMATQSGEAELLFAGILYDIDRLNETVSSEFAGENNTFIYDSTSGVMLYHNFGIRLLIDGFNIYPKFAQCEISFGDDSAALEAACRNGETVVTAITIDGEQFYFCSAPLNAMNWSLAFIVQVKYLNGVSGNSFSDIVLYISLICATLGLVILGLFLLFYRNALNQRSLVKIKQLNTDLESANSAKSDFLSNMSHDIRTPINGIMGMTTIARRVEGNPAKTIECLDKIDGASHHLLSLINDVLDMTRIERGKTEIAHDPIDIRLVSDNCCSIIRGQMNGRNLNLISDFECEHPYLLGDDLHLRQIFINILGNAVKFTPDGGTITFRCRETEATESTATLAFEIEDTGIGMKPEFLTRIFDAFTQDEAGARSTYKGTGLGMAITKQLTELMGGTIAVESEFGKGSKFTVIVPFPINADVPEEKEEAVDDEGGIEGMKILLAEDNELNMEIATELLEDAGATVIPAADGKQALEAFRDHPAGTYDVILMDVMMPVMNGLDATKAIRALPRADAQTIPILAMTANAFESDIQATAEAGMNAHLSKPINITAVIKAIAHYTKARELS